MNQEKFSKEELEEARERNARARKFKNGSVWNSNNYGTFTIIGRFDKDYMYVQFTNTKAIAIRSLTTILNGNVKDYYAPNIYGVAFMGEGIYTHKSHKSLYKRWYNMLARCYGDRDKYPSYKDCTVDSRWFDFQVFAEDITNMMIEQGLESLDGYSMDKDIKQSSGAKVYSKDTVSLVTWHENNDEMLNRVNDTVYIAENLVSGEVIEFTNQSQFARDYNLYSTHISRILRGERKSAKNWTFRRKED